MHEARHRPSRRNPRKPAYCETGRPYLRRTSGLEAFIRYLMRGGILGSGGFVEEVLGNFSWPRFIATQLWIGVLFLIYVSARELNELLGDGELSRILFRRRSSALKETRRARIRLFTRLSRLTESHPIAALENPASPEHSELVAILKTLAQTAATQEPAPVAE